MKYVISFLIMAIVVCGGSVYWITKSLKKDSQNSQELILKELATQRDILISKLKEQEPAVIAFHKIQVKKIEKELLNLKWEKHLAYKKQQSLTIEIASLKENLKENNSTIIKLSQELEQAKDHYAGLSGQVQNTQESLDRKLASTSKVSMKDNKNLLQVYSGFGRTSTKITETPSSFDQKDQKGFLFGAGYSREIINNHSIGISVFSNEDVYLQTGWGF